MTESNSFFTQPDFVSQRKRALAKVYALLIRLAEEVESNPNRPSTQTTQENADGKSQNQDSSVNILS